MWRFYFEDSLEPVEWWDEPSNKAGPWDTFGQAMDALFASGMVHSSPADACYLLMTERQRETLAARLTKA